MCLRDGSPDFPRDGAGEGAWTCGGGGNLSVGEGRPRLCFFPKVTYDLGAGLGIWLALVSSPGRSIVLQQHQQLQGLHRFTRGVQSPNWIL